MTANMYISGVKLNYKMGFQLPKQSQRSKSVMQDRSGSLRLFWKGIHAYCYVRFMHKKTQKDLNMLTLDWKELF